MKDKYYVYKHIDEHGETVYVGCGVHERAYRTGRQNKEHQNFLRDRNIWEVVEIVASNLKRTEAGKIERQLIYSTKPKFNVYGVVDMAHPNAKLTAEQKREIALIDCGGPGKKVKGDNRPSTQDLANQYGVDRSIIIRVRKQGRAKNQTHPVSYTHLRAHRD